MTSTAVRVALRVRPLTQKEHISNCTECITFIPDQPQILIGKDHSFTYDYVFDTNSQQKNIYNTCVVPLTEKFVDGFNATILAYGQTGSGKTFSMGTALDDSLDSEQQGIIPRFIFDLFERLEHKRSKSLVDNYQVYVSFLELYNEDFVDLLNVSAQQFNRKRSNSVNNPNFLNNQTSEVQIREDVCGQIYWSGVREELCSSPDDLLRYLTKGSLCRTTGSTDMNSVSSRSHAIFSVILKQKVSETNETEDQTVPSSEEMRTLVSKFHFVDLAGSERLKRTKAEGNRAREGISINSGLLALGNVISALGDESRKSTHVPYRDSKLTRLLQDSLGGNSQTLMMACVSPSDSNFLETLSTLKYANRAKNIKNKVAINQEFAGSSVEVNQLKAQVARLKLELNALRGGLSAAGGDKNATTKSSSDMMINNMLYTHDTGGSTAAAKALKEEIDRLKARVRTMSDDICRITTERDSLQMERELAEHLNSPEWPSIMNQLQCTPSSDQSPIHTLPIIAQYQKTIKELREELSDTQERLAFSESIRAPLMQAMAIPPSNHATPQTSFRTVMQKQQSTTTNKRRGANKKRRMINGSNTTTSRNVTFRSTRRSKVPNIAARKDKPETHNALEHKQTDDDIEAWIQETIGSIQTSESSGLRLDAKTSISNAKSQIEKALKVLDDFKSKESEKIEYDCDILNDDELFVKLQSDDIQSLFGDAEENRTSSDNVGFSHVRMPSTDTNFSINDDQELFELCQNHPQLSQMLDQIQSDIQVNEDLMQQLEKTETEYSEMRKKFEKKLLSLRDEILELRQQQEQTSANASAVNLNHIRLAYEGKMKNLMNQLSELRRKYTQTSSTIQSSRNQNESIIRALRGNVETLKAEKRRMIKRMKEEAERVKEQMQSHEREIQLLRRKQSKDNEVRKRLEREVKQMQLIIGKKTDESVVTAEKLKALVQILKKAVREGGVLDEKLLASCSSLLDIGSVLAHSAKMTRISRGRHNKRRQYNGVPLEARATKKKALLDNALYQFIQGKQAVEEMKQLLAKRNDLSQRKIEYMSERELLLFDQDNKDLSSIDHAFVRVIDENIETVEAEISYINARIHAIHNDAAAEIMQEDEADEVEIIDMSQKPVEKRVTFAENSQTTNSKKAMLDTEEDNWLDMDALEERYSLPSSAGPEQSLEMISKILRSMTKDEASHVMESVIDDIVLLRMEEHNNKLTIQQLEKSAQDLRRTLIVMKKAAIDTTIENEKKLKRMQQQQQQVSSRRTSMTRELRRLSSHSSPTMEDSSDVDSAIDLHSDDSYQHVESMFEKIYNDGINGKIPTYEYGVTTSGVESISPVAVIENELSPYLRPESVIGSSSKNNVQAPIKPSSSPLACRRRDSMSSPEQFLQQLLQTPKDVRPPPSPLMKPSEFTRYQHERESSTSSIRTRSYTSFTRRSSLQSDNGSVSSMHMPQQGYSHQMRRASSGSRLGTTEQHNAALPPVSNLNRRRAFSFQQPAPNATNSNAAPPTNLRRRSLLRELSNSSLNAAYESMAPTSPKSYQHNFNQEYSTAPLIPAFNHGHHNNSTVIFSQHYNSQQNLRPHSVLALHAASIPPPPRPASKISAYPRKESPNNSYELRKSIANNVFDRLSNGHTHASQAKQKSTQLHRYSSSSLDDLRKQWASELSTRTDY